MRQTSSIFMTLLLGAAITACSSPAAAPPQGATPAVQAPASPTAQTPVSTGACTPGTSAMELPSGPYGTGINLPPVPAGATAEKPAFGYLSVTQLFLHEGGGRIVGNVYLRQGGIATVDAGEFTLEGRLQPAPAEDWYKTRLQVTGVQPSEQSYLPAGGGWFHLRIPNGQAGDSFRVTLKDVLKPDGTPGDLTVDFCRQTPPEAIVAEQAKDGSRVRLAFSHAMMRETVERSLKGPHDKDGNSQGAWISSLTWLDDRTVDLTVAQPAPQVLRFNLTAAQDTNGLFVEESPANLYLGNPPTAVAVDPVSGQSATLATLPPEPTVATASPDGKWLRYTAMQLRSGVSSPDWQHLLVDLTTGQAVPIQPEELYGTWTASGDVLLAQRDSEYSLVVTRRGVTGEPRVTRIADLPAFDSIIPSPDGNWLALLVRADNPGDGFIGTTFLMVSTDGKTRTPLDGRVTVYRPGKDGIRLYGPAWSPDSSRLAMTEARDGRTALLIADLKAGALRTLAEDLPGVKASFDPVTWSPDGRQILVGPALVDTATGKVVKRVEGVEGQPYWSPDGKQLLFQASAWEKITAYDLGSGKATDLGAGLLVGWRPDGKALIIRWPDADQRSSYGI